MSTAKSKPRKRASGRPSAEAREALQNSIFAAASKAFVEHGFEGVSMDEIARLANTSKQTIYARFPTKSALFAAFVAWRFQNQAAPKLAEPDNRQLPPERYLLKLGMLLLQSNIGQEGRALSDLLRTALKQTPEMAQIFWDKGPGRGRHLLKAYLEYQVQQGTLHIPNLELAMEQFLGLVIGGAVFRISRGMPPLYQGPARERRWVKSCVELFLHHYR